MKQILTFLMLLISVAAFAQTDPTPDKFTGVAYFNGVPDVTPDELEGYTVVFNTNNNTWYYWNYVTDTWVQSTGGGDVSAQTLTDSMAVVRDSLAAIRGDIGSGGTGITDGDKGDITVSNSGATWQISNQSVTSEKLQANPFRRVVIDTAGVLSDRSDMPSAVMLGSDSIYVVYQQFPGATGDQAVSYIVGRMSTDGGFSWSNADNIIVNNHPGLDSVGYGVQCPSLLYRGDTLHMVFLGNELNHSAGDPYYDNDHYYVYSTDFGETWSTAQKISTNAEYHAPASDRLYNDNGRFVYVTSQSTANSSDADVNSCSGYIPHLLYSDDGTNWTIINTGVQPPGGFGAEPGIVILEDGTYMLYMRTCDNYIYQAFSSDRGQTWTQAEKTELHAENSMSTIEKILPKQDLVATWTPQSFNQDGIVLGALGNDYLRRRLYVAVSPNDGYTWEPALELFSGTVDNPLAFEPTMLYDEENNKLHVFVSEDVSGPLGDSYELVDYVIDYNELRVSTLAPDLRYNRNFESLATKDFSVEEIRDSSYIDINVDANGVNEIKFFDDFSSDRNGAPRINAINNSTSNTIPAFRIVPVKGNGLTSLSSTDLAFTVQNGVNQIFAVRGNGDLEISGQLTQSTPNSFLEINPEITTDGLEISRGSGFIKWALGTGTAGTFWPFKRIRPAGPYGYLWEINQTASSSTQTMMDWEFQTSSNGSVSNSILHRWTNNGSQRMALDSDGDLTITGVMTAASYSGIQESDLPTRPATDITATDAGGYFTGNDLEAITQELGADVSTAQSDIITLQAKTVAPANPTHNTSLTFQNSKYYQPFTVTADTLTYTADTTSGVFGSYTVARVGFGDPGRPVIFDGTVFDTVQMYNIASGDSLSGVHMLYFEHTPYGVAVSVPTNSRTVVDTIEGGNSSSDPALTKSGGLALYTGLEGLTQVNDTLVQWIDQINQDTARNTTAAFEPAITGLGVNFEGDNHLQINTGFQFQDSIAITAAFNVTGIPVTQNSIFGEETDGGTLDLNYNRFDGGFTAFKDATVTTPGDTIAQNDMVVLQVSCAGGSCEFWKNGVSIGSDTFTETLPKTYSILGALNNTGNSPLKGTLYYLSVHRATYTTEEITAFFNYVNTEFNMGL